MRVVAVVNQKGGAGKTTTVMNLASLLAETSRVLVVDVDPQQSATWWATAAGDRLPFDFAPEVDPDNLQRLRILPYDTILVDTPGNLAETGVLSAVLDRTDFAIVPTEPEALCIAPMLRTIHSLIEPRGVDYRVLLNKIDFRITGQYLAAAELLGRIEVPQFAHVIRRYKIHADAPLDGTVVTGYRDSRQRFKALDDYRAVANELMAMWASERTAAHR